MKGIEHAGKGAARKPGKAAAAARRPAARAVAPADKTDTTTNQHRRIDPVGKFLIENRGALGMDHTLDT